MFKSINAGLAGMDKEAYQRKVTEGTIGLKFNMLANNIEMLKNEIAELENVLSPILKGQTPQTDSVTDEEQTEPGSPVSLSIHTACNTVKEIISMVRSIRERIDL